MNTRTLARTIPSRPTSDGAGVKLRRSLGQAPGLRLDPFLLLDEFSSDNPDDYIAGFPAHPHRGFETVTYLLAGHLRHEDHLGHRGELRGGGAQWMTAGRGIVHSEMPQQEEGRLHGFQLWINLPAREKMKPAAYRDLQPEDIPRLPLAGGGELKVIAGTAEAEAAGLPPDRPEAGQIPHGRPEEGRFPPGGTAPGAAAAPVRPPESVRGLATAALVRLPGPIHGMSTAPLFLDVRLPAGGRFAHAIDAGHNALVYPYTGRLLVGAAGEQHPLEAHAAGVLSAGERVELEAGAEGAAFLLLAARPLGEPVVQYGPFVMNTREEIEQAIQDYQHGRLA